MGQPRINAFFPCPSDYVKDTTTRSCCPEGLMRLADTCEPKRTVVDLAVGADHNCLLLDDGSVQCWGKNEHGSKDGGATSTTGMTTVNLGQRAVEVESGWRHNCAILEDRTVKCWGRNDEGQTTNPTTGDEGIVEVDLGDDSHDNPLKALTLSLGGRHTCAIVDDGYGDGLGTVKCWGKNDLWQKDGTDTPSNTSMVTVDLGSSDVRARALALGNKHSCAILQDGSVKCWGNNANGQRGGASGLPNLGGRRALAIAAGAGHTCALLDNKKVKCWGHDNYNQKLGGGAGSTLNLGARAKKIGLGYHHSCAILMDGTVKCWGLNGDDQKNPEDGGSEYNVSQVDLGAGRTALQIGGGWRHTCALLDDHSVKCWGKSDDTRSNSPPHRDQCPLGWVDDSTLGYCRAPSADKYTDLERAEQNCDKTTTPIADSATLGGQALPFLTDSTCPYTCNTTYLKKEDDRTCVFADACPTGYVRDTVSVLCRPPSEGHYADASGAEQACEAIAGSATLGGAVEDPVLADNQSCDFECEKGYTKNTSQRSCTAPATGSYFDISGTEQSCDPALNAESVGAVGGGPLLVRGASACPFTCPAGHVKNEEDRSCCLLGQVKVGATCRAVRTVVDLGVGADHSCMVLDDDSVQCWGANDEQQKDGTGTNNADRVRVNLGRKALAVEAGSRHTCAILEDRRVKCWGRNDEGQTTNPTDGDNGIVAVDLGWDSAGLFLGALEIDLGKNHTCAIVDDGDGDALGPVKCWGANDEEQKDGTGTNNGNRVTVDLGGRGVGGVTAKALALGGAHSCAILNNDTVKCWGRDDEGQTGTNGVPDLGQGRTAVALAAGKNHTCALLDDTSVKCWGDNAKKEIGRGTPIFSGAQALSLGGSSQLRAFNQRFYSVLGERHSGSSAGELGFKPHRHGPRIGGGSQLCCFK